AIPCRSDFLFPLHEDTCDILGKAGGFGRERASAGDVELKTSPKSCQIVDGKLLLLPAQDA
uniref:Secreted protein n=1 Tax=Mesocestoides corti TaxID=53468 RepID=A0A5K3FXE8_MESCO